MRKLGRTYEKEVRKEIKAVQEHDCSGREQPQGCLYIGNLLKVVCKVDNLYGGN